MGVVLDASHYQRDRGPINWGAVAQMADALYEKITEGLGYIDPSWQDMYDGAGGVGLPRGAYHFADIGNPSAEADHFANVFLTRKWQLVPVLDIEKGGATANWINVFRTQFRQRTGCAWLRTYSSQNMLAGVLNPANWIDSQSDIWAARYNTTLGWDHPSLVLWQNTSTATIPGILGSVDESQKMHGWTPAVDLARMGVTQPLPPPIPNPNPTPHPITGKLPPNTILELGSKGPAVVLLQRALNTQYPSYSHLVIDGDYGKLTQGVVREFQTRAHLHVDGVAGPQTLKALYLE